jgi:hypothetical protein
MEILDFKFYPKIRNIFFGNFLKCTMDIGYIEIFYQNKAIKNLQTTKRALLRELKTIQFIKHWKTIK